MQHSHGLLRRPGTVSVQRAKKNTDTEHETIAKSRLSLLCWSRCFCTTGSKQVHQNVLCVPETLRELLTRHI